MKKLSATIAQLAAMRSAIASSTSGGKPGRLRDLKSFGTNPGALKAKIHIPASLADKPALVVVLHGCTQTAEGYDRGSGWSQLADEHGFALLFPEQQRGNNPNLCFNWFSPADNARDGGEALSIRQMIATMIDTYGIDPSGVFVTGLSAGGAMTSIMLATYPELFAGGAIIAGLPYGSAANVSQALEAMRGPGTYSSREIGDRVRRASGHTGPWPKVAVWHGTADATVNSTNADAILAQWLSVHSVGDAPATSEIVAGHHHRIWRDADGHSVVEDYRIANMGHGTPLSTSGAEACGTVMPHMLEAGISSTRLIARSWGLLTARAASAVPDMDQKTPNLPVESKPRLQRINSPDPVSADPASSGVEKVIQDAFRAAGLIR
ncbi:MAG: extracellular catalytic domain type 1 short-chain-length polyhydroxyalkanoate depolymerase [Sphingobium sp.]